MRRITDLSGKSFGKLTVISFAHNNDGRVWWNCLCSCGKSVVQRSDHFKSGLVVSCGCVHKEITRALFTKHGEASPPYSQEYSSWLHMKSRCLNKNNRQFHDYGGRGIKICKKWLQYELFLKDMGRAPSIEHTIDRLNVNGNYCKNNCKWSTYSEQQNNKRNSIKIEHNGVSRTQQEWCREYNIPYTTARSRRLKGLPFHEIFKSV